MGDLHRRPTQIGDIRFDDQGSKELDSATDHSSTVISSAKLKRRQLADASPVRALPINADQSSFNVIRNIEHISKKTKKEISDQPHHNYQEFMSLDQAGPAVIAYDNDYKLYAIKRVEAKSVSTARIQLFRDVPSVVSVQDIYTRGDKILIVYECMEISLQHVLATPRGHLSAREIAAICKQLLSGLSYIHDKLDLHHGHLDCGQLLLNRAGQIKIANIGQKMLESCKTAPEQKQKDIRNVGTMMMEIMEPATSLEDGESIVLQHPERWGQSGEIKTFLRATATASVRELKDHMFLLDSPSSACLIPHVLMAQVSVRTDWKIFSLVIT